jgi:molybdenum cofactor cytidylyltransferase
MNPSGDSITNVAIVILAAGASRRLGMPKQLLQYKGQSLLIRAVYAALEASPYRLIVICGAHEREVTGEMDIVGVEIIRNIEWQEGIASSIRCSMTELMKDTNAGGVLFMVCDQPHVSSALLASMMQTQQHTGMPIVACSYGGGLGIPALFHKKFFTELAALTGDAGAKNIIRKHDGIIAIQPFAAGAIDIDTVIDYSSLLAGD